MSFHSLSPREKQILKARGLGRLNKEISDNLGISINTVKHHLSSVFRKLEVSSSLEAVALLP